MGITKNKRHDSAQIGRFRADLYQSGEDTKTHFGRVDTNDLYFQISAEADLLFGNGQYGMIYQMEIDFDLAYGLIELLGITGENYNEESLSLEMPHTDYWENFRHLRRMKEYKTTRQNTRCRLCDKKSKRTGDLLCTLPDRDCYSDNGWYKPMLGVGISGIAGLHEDCLGQVLCLVHKAIEQNSTIVMANQI